MAEVPSTRRKKSHRIWRKFLVPAAVLLGLAYFILRPIPPREYPQLGDFEGTLTVSHAEAILNAQLSEHSSRYLIDTLRRCKFKPYRGDPAQCVGDIVLNLTDRVKITLSDGGKQTYALVENGDSKGYYQLGGDVYEEVASIISDAFPDGVQVLEFQPWWEEYLCIAARTLMDSDFKSPKEIPVDSVVSYTYQQMVADSSAKEFQITKDGVSTDNIPYDLFLRRARRYFADGANSSIKQNSNYNPDTNTLNFRSMPAEYYGNYPYGDSQDYKSNRYYALKSLTRDSSGAISAVFEDYNSLGFKEQGTLTKLHHLTLVPAAQGEYRFVSKHSELANPENVSAEGYFLNLSTIAQMTPDQAYANDLSNGDHVGDKFLLHTIKYSKESAKITFYLIDPQTGEQIETRTLEADGKTIFWDIVTADDDEILVKTNQNIIRLNGALEEVGAIPLPLSKLPGFDATGYDITADRTKLIYSDDEGVKTYDLKSGMSSMIAEHPYELEISSPSLTPSTPSSSSSVPYVSKWTRPLESFLPPPAPTVPVPLEPPTTTQRVITEYYRRPVLVDDETKIVVANVGAEEVNCYSLIDLKDDRHKVTRLGVVPITGGVEYIDNDKILITQFPDPTAQEEAQSSVTEHSIQYFSGSPARRFSLDYDFSVPTQLIEGDYLYYFALKQAPLENVNDRYYQLCRIDLKKLETQELSVLIQNALPDLLGVCKNGQVLFSYRAPAGSGFGITRESISSAN